MGHSIWKSTRQNIAERIPETVHTHFGSEARSRRREKKEAAKESRLMPMVEALDDPQTQPQQTGAGNLAVVKELPEPEPDTAVSRASSQALIFDDTPMSSGSRPSAPEPEKSASAAATAGKELSPAEPEQAEPEQAATEQTTPDATTAGDESPPTNLNAAEPQKTGLEQAEPGQAEPEQAAPDVTTASNELSLASLNAAEFQQAALAAVVLADNDSPPVSPTALEPEKAVLATETAGDDSPPVSPGAAGPEQTKTAARDFPLPSPGPSQRFVAKNLPFSEPLSKQTTQGSVSFVDSGLGTARSGSLASSRRHWSTARSESLLSSRGLGAVRSGSLTSSLDPEKYRRVSGTPILGRHLEEDPDAITPAPPASSKPAHRDPVVEPLKGPEVSESCGICGVRIGMTGRYQKSIERKAYLPCGHAFGHECLFNWITNVREQRQQCPLGNCTTLRHYCEHLTAPMKVSPLLAYGNKYAAVIPWNYEFCETPIGKELHHSIHSEAFHVREAEKKLKQHDKSFFEMVYQGMVMLHIWMLKRAEKKLDKKHKLWWKNQWKNFWNDIGNEKHAGETEKSWLRRPFRALEKVDASAAKKRHFWRRAAI